MSNKYDKVLGEYRESDAGSTAETDPIVASRANGFTITRGTTPATLTVAASGSVSGSNTGDNVAASTSVAGLAPQATAPASGLYNYVGITNGETAYTNKALFDATVPETQAFGDSAATGSAVVAARRDHKHAMMAAPTSVTGNAGTVTTNANLTGPVTSVGNATTLTQSRSFVITNPTIASDLPLWRAPTACTITAVHLLCKTQIIVGQLWEYDANGLNGATVDASDITGVVDTNVNDDGALSNPGIASGNYVGWKTTSATAGATYAIVTFDFTTP